MRRKSGLGFTIIELMIASSLSVLVLAGATAGLIQAMRAWRAAGIRSELHLNLERSMERMRHDLRLSSVGIGLMAFYPADAAEYTAISFPLATPNADGMLPRDANGVIIWDTTVVYHVRPGSPDELIRSTFAPRHTAATPAELYDQLYKVVKSASLEDVKNAAMGSEVATSQVIFQNLVNMVFRPPEMRFDGYAPQYERSRRFTWGSVVLGNGPQELTFTVERKNADSSGYKVGIDRFSMSNSGSPREGESVLPEDSRPRSPYFGYEVDGGTVAAQDMSEHGASWSGLSQLTFTPSSTTAGGSKITFEVDNDLWHDTNFDNPPGEYAFNCERQIDRSFTNQAPNIPDIVIGMKAGITWDVENITSDYTNRNLNVTEVVNVLSSDAIVLNGSFARLQFASGATKKLQVRDVSIAGPVGSLGTNLNSGAYTWRSVKFPGGSDSFTIDANTNAWTDWSSVSIPIDEGTNYLVRWFTNKGDADPLTDARIYTGSNVHSYVDGSITNEMIGLVAMDVRAPSTGLYRSGVFDTRIADPVYKTMTWSQVEPWPGGDVDIRLRSSDFPDMSDVPNWWSPMTYHQGNGDNNISALNGGRYVQYEVLFTVTGDHTQLPILRDVTITWDAPMGIVDLVVDLAKGPDYGVITADVNGQQFIKGVEVELEIFKDGPYGLESVPGIMEVRPLNTGR